MVETNPGTVLAGKYRVERVIGTGGMGVVVAALHEQLDERVAIKLLRADRLAQHEAVERALREARATVKIQSEHVVRVFDVGTLDTGAPYIVMEYLSGCDLAQLLCAEGKLDVADSASYVRQACDAVVKAHALGIIHRDLKPANLFLSVRGETSTIKVLDFGISKFVSTDQLRVDPALTSTASVLGSPAYMSPEQLESPRDIDGRTDVWSLGVILFELVTGAHPFVADTLPQLYKKIATAPAPSLRSIRPDVPADLEAIVARCLAKDPADRFADVAALSDALAPFAQDAHGHTAAALADTAMASGAEIESARLASKVSGQPAPGIAVAVTHRKRRRALFAGLGMAGVAAAAMSTMMCVRADDGHRAPPPAQPAGAPLAKAGSVLACPPLAVKGVEQPAGWLGAAAASIACVRADVRMGGDSDRALLPAELLDLPRAAVDGFPEDAYADPASRDRAIAAAKARGQAWLDGEVEHAGEQFHVTLVLRAGDREVARGAGTADGIVGAVRAAMQPLERQIPAAKDNDPFLREWYGATTTDAAVAIADWSIANRLNWPDKVGCDELLARKDILPGAVETIHTNCVPEMPDRPTRDTSSPGALAMSIDADGHDEKRPLAAEIAQLDAVLAKVTTHQERAFILGQKASVYSNHRDYDAAMTAALAALDESPDAFYPWTSAWIVLAWVRSNSNAAPAALAWTPWNSEVYCFAATRAAAAHPAVAYMRRNVILSRQPIWQEALAGFLVSDRAVDEASAIAAKLPGNSVAAVVEAGEGRFAHALTDAEKIVQHGGTVYDRADAAWVAADLGVLLGKRVDGLDGLVAELLDKHPEQLDMLSEINLTLACTTAPHDLAHHCLHRLHELTGGVVFFDKDFLPGAEKYADGDYAGAAKAWRSLVAHPDWHLMFMHDLLAEAFERASDSDNAARIDARFLNDGRFNGAELAHVREALRAEKRGDVETARAMAKKVIDAWSVADADVPAVAEMRKLVARLDRRSRDHVDHAR